MGVGRYRLRRAGGDDLSSAIAAFRAQIDDPVRGLDDVQVVFDHHHGVAVIAQPVEYGQQLFDVMKVQARSRLIQDIQRLSPVLNPFPRSFASSSPALLDSRFCPDIARGR